MRSVLLPVKNSCCPGLYLPSILEIQHLYTAEWINESTSQIQSLLFAEEDFFFHQFYSAAVNLLCDFYQKKQLHSNTSRFYFGRLKIIQQGFLGVRVSMFRSLFIPFPGHAPAIGKTSAPDQIHSAKCVLCFGKALFCSLSEPFGSLAPV